MENLTEKQIRQMIRQEIRNNETQGSFRLRDIPKHVHDGIDSLKIHGKDIIPSVSVSGRITFSQETDYTINLNANFTPSSVIMYGIAYDATGGTGVRCMIDGSANLGPSFYLQPDTATSVKTGNIQYPFIDPNINGGTFVPLQSSSYLWVDNGSTTFHGQPGEGHIIDVQWSGTIYARATITEFTKNKVVVHVSDLASGWEIYTNVVIT